MLFCINHDGLAEKGLEINKRLCELADSPEQEAGYLLDAAELYCNMQNDAEAEAVYRDIVKRFPENEWGLLGYARYLTEKGRKEEAEDFYRRVITLGSKAKDAVECAKEELEELLNQ